MRRACVWLPAALALLAALGACSTSPALVDERVGEPYAGWLRQGQAQPGRSLYVRAEDPGRPPLVLHLREVRAPGGRERPLLVLQPGLLSDHATWRFLAPQLAERYDLLLVDPPGTGASDKPRAASLPADGYSPAWLGRHTLRAVRTWLRYTGEDRRLVLLGHSLGSTALLRALAEPATRWELPDVCARVDRLVLFAPPDIAMRRVSPVFQELAALTTLEADLGDALGILDARVAQSVRDAVVDPAHDALCQQARRLTLVLATCGTRRAAQAMLRRFRPADEQGRPFWPLVEAQAALHRRVTVPTLIVWGRLDDTLSPTMGTKLAAWLPHARLEVLEGAKHSPHQERAAACALLVRRFLEERP